MTAQWNLLTEFLSSGAPEVRVSWAELDAIVGGVPTSAIDHYPQWWCGDRSHTRAWRRAGYEATQIEPGVSVCFVRRGTARPTVSAPVQRARHASDPTDAPMSANSLDQLRALDPSRCLIVIPCSGTKVHGGEPGQATPAATADLQASRRRILALPDSSADQSLVMPAWRRYTGNLYRSAGSALARIAADGRLVILSGGYGVLDGRDLVGYYERRLRLSEWPPGVLERALAERARGDDLAVVAFLGAKTRYAQLARRTGFRSAGDTATLLVSMRNLRGVTAISAALGRAVAAFVDQTGDFPATTVVERLPR